MRVMKAPILLSTALAICALDMSAQHFEADGIAYDIIASGQVEVSASNPEQPYKGFVIIPATVSNDNTVYSVTRISEEAFRDCINLTAVSMPESVTEIGENAFRGCLSLNGITIPATVTKIGEGAFKSIPLENVSLNPEACPEAGDIFTEGYPVNFSVPANSVESYMGNMPELFSGRCRLSLDFEESSEYPILLNGRMFCEDFEDRSHDVPISLLEKGSLTSRTTNAFFIKKGWAASLILPIPIGAGPLAFTVDGTSIEDTSSNAMYGITGCHDIKGLEGTPFDIFQYAVVLEFKSVVNEHSVVITRLSSVDVINDDEAKGNMSHIYGMDGTSMTSRPSQGIYIMTDGKNAVKRLMP